MLHYGQFCPISKAMEVLGERWTILIVRELLLGATRFSELQRGLPTISPTMLNRRLAEMVDCGLVDKSARRGGRGHANHQTPAGQDLQPALVALGSWGMRWARGQMRDEELDVQQLMYDIQRQFDPGRLPRRGRSVIQFHFSELTDYADWWLKIDDEQVDLCIDEPGDEIQLLITSTLRCLTEIWMGDTSLAQARRQRRLELLGQTDYERSIDRWLGRHMLADIRPAAG